MTEKGKCQVCSKISESRCSWCRLVFYCSKEHQKQDWDSHKASCTKKKYTIESDETLGRHLVSSEDIKADWILLKDRPILLSIKANSLEFTPNKICLGCYKEIKVDDDVDDDSSDSSSSSGGGNGGGSSSTSSSNRKTRKVCLKCELPLCSQACSSHYFHKAFECRLISEGTLADNDDQEKNSHEGDSRKSCSPGPNHPLPEAAEATNTTAAQPKPNIRETILKHLIYFRCILLKHISPSQWDEMMTLQSDDEARRDVQNLERTTGVFNMLKGILKQINHPTINQVYKPDVHKILGILDINALHFNISQEVELSALFPTFSLVEHSCIPNVRFYLSPLTPGGGGGRSKSKGGKYLFELYCRSAVKIKKGENLSVSHVNLMWNTEKRREFLKKERGFWCNCPRCQDPAELGSNFSTIICSQEGCTGYAVPVPKNPLNLPELHWKCGKCSKYTPPWHVKKLDIRLCETVGRAKASLQSYKQLLNKMDECVHPDYYLSFVLNHSLVQLYGEKDVDNDSEDEDVRMHNAKMLEEKVALCNRLLHLIKIIDPGLAKLNIYTAVIYYEMQSAILAMAGGEVDDDYTTLRHKPETVKLAKLYLLKCIDCFKYELLDVPENKLKNLAYKKLEYLEFILTKLHKTRSK